MKTQIYAAPAVKWLSRPTEINFLERKAITTNDDCVHAAFGSVSLPALHRPIVVFGLEPYS